MADYNENKKSIPHSRIIKSLYALADHGTAGAVTDQDPKEFDLDDLGDYHEGLFMFQLTSLNGQGGTPTSPGAAVTFTLSYAYSTVQLNNPGDAPTTLDGVKTTLVHTFPDNALVASAQAAVVLTQTANPTATETVTLGSTVYTFEATAASAYDVAIGSDLAETQKNFLEVINGTNVRGVQDVDANGDLTTPVHPTVSAITGETADTIEITALLAGTAGNSIASTETLAAGSFAAATLLGGLATGANVSQQTDPEIHKGRYLYTWYDRDAYAANALTDVDIDLIRI